MNNIEFPNQLKILLEDSRLQSPVRDLADRVGTILEANSLTFFPDYTDHGINHISDVLQSIVDLIPDDVWKQSKKDSSPRLLRAEDATVIIGATLLHDIAMHLTIKGFRELISEDTRFKPLPWFKDEHEGHYADRPWPELWRDYEREARRFSDRILINIIGEEAVHSGWKFDELPTLDGDWTLNHRLVVGEFIRRHHARLAHEIAIYGFPGLDAGSRESEFPALGATGHQLYDLADLIGLTARSHWLDLRVCQKYLEDSPLYPKAPRQRHTATLYAMALLRVADYLQIDKHRAPAVLLQLKNPPSPISVQEWTKHNLVPPLEIVKDQRKVSVPISPPPTLQLYLQIEELLVGLQKEMDHSTAVLDDVYGMRKDLGLHHLNLAIRRVDSKLHDPRFLKDLDYVPQRTGFSTDPNLLTLLVEPLYGAHPGVGVRELMQNSVDAVCELEAWCKTHNKPIESLDLPQQDCDVLIEFIKENDTWFLRVTDKGIGMTAETIQNYFLRAGASFRQSAEWANEFMDEEGKPRVLRAGRFGIGAFATFLLGPTFRLWTRHVTANKDAGFTLTASEDSGLIEIQTKEHLPVGTKIEVELSTETVDNLKLEEERKEHRFYESSPAYLTDWFSWDWPVVKRRVNSAGKTEELPQHEYAPIRKSALLPEWSIIHPTGFDAVFWTFDLDNTPHIVCNGIRIIDPDVDEKVYPLFVIPESQLNSPNIAVLDNRANLPLTIKRDSLSCQKLPFVIELARDLTFSFIAYALICGPASQIGIAPSGPYSQRHPLNADISSFSPYGENSLLTDGLLRWCSTEKVFVPVDPWLYTYLQAESCLLYGTLHSRVYERIEPLTPLAAEIPHVALLCWDAQFKYFDDKDACISSFLNQLCNFGVTALGHEIVSSRVIISVQHNIKLVAPEIPRKNISFNPQRTWHELRFGESASITPMEDILITMEKEGNRSSDCLYVAELKTKFTNLQPESLIAKIWNECLGPIAIPFDPEARRALIEKGRQHPELKRHIEKWEEMKRTGSKWAQ